MNINSIIVIIEAIDSDINEHDDLVGMDKEERRIISGPHSDSDLHTGFVERFIVHSSDEV